MSAVSPLRAWRCLLSRPLRVPLLPLREERSRRLAATGGCVHRRGVYTSASLGDGSRLLKHIAEQSSRSFTKWTLDELLRLKDVSAEERLRVLEEVLHVGISKIVVLLQDLPLGFSATAPLRSVITDYAHDVQDLLQVTIGDKERFHKCIKRIFSRHRGMMATIASGLAEFQEEITHSFEPFGDVPATRCPDVSESVPDIMRIEKTLDEFFTIRTTLRLLIAHCLQLNQDSADGASQHERKEMRELLVRVPHSVREASRAIQRRHVGAICLDTRPSLILVEAYRHVDCMCRRDLQRSCDLLINGIPSEEYLAANAFNDDHFPYVDIHLYFVFFELLKNACITSLSKAGPDGTPEPIHASVIAGTSLVAENERSVKITDVGEGIRREDRMKVWSYFYSTRQAARLRDQDQPHRFDFENGFGSERSRGAGKKATYPSAVMTTPMSLRQGTMTTPMSLCQANDSDGESDGDAERTEPQPQENRQLPQLSPGAKRPRSDAADLVRGQKCRPLLSSIDGPESHMDWQNKSEEEAQPGGPPQQGHGLGLPVSRVLTRYFDGEIEINSLPRKGTDVYVYL